MKDYNTEIKRAIEDAEKWGIQRALEFAHDLIMQHAQRAFNRRQDVKAIEFRGLADELDRDAKRYFFEKPQPDQCAQPIQLMPKAETEKRDGGGQDA